MRPNLSAVLLLFIFLLTGQASGFGQSDGPVITKGYFRNPLNIPMSLSANFGELRSNHWHMGLDIRTNRQENLPVHAAAEGYVARASIQPYGFGLAIYIVHPNGYTTVYGHLNAFYPALEQRIKEEQYRNESWAIDLKFSPQEFPVQKGQFIGKSGNTGGSQGPHLHFEIRETESEKCVNPLLFGFATEDRIAPVISKLAIYDRSRGLFDQSPRFIPVVKPASGDYKTNPVTVETSSRLVSFAIGATDRTNISSGPNGIYSASLKWDGRVVSLFVLDKVGYDETLFLNAQIDYRYKALGGSYVQHLSHLPGDASPVYRFPAGSGILELSDQETHTVEIEVRDHNSNKSFLRFNIRYKPGAAVPAPVGEKFPPQYISVLERPGFETMIREGSLYDTVHAGYKRTESFPAGAISALHGLGSYAVPLHERIQVRIKPDKPVATEWRQKLLVKRVSGKSTAMEKPGWEGEWLEFDTRFFGTYQVFVDTIPPVLNTIGNAAIVDLRKSSSILFRPTDNFEGIRSFRAELDGQWLRFSNDKGKTFIYRFDEYFPPGRHKLKVVVEDLVGNKTVKEWEVIR